MKNIFRISEVILLILLTHSCEKDKLPAITTTNVTEISYTTATSGGEIISDSGVPVVKRGVCWDTHNMPTLIFFSIDSSEVSNITGLKAGTTYYVRAYATNSVGTGYGNEVSFTTSQVAVPVLTTTAITAIMSTTAISGGNITADNGGSVTARGVCWGTASNPTTAGNKTTAGTGTGTFTSSITGLTLDSTYFVRAYAINSGGTSYGNEVSFTTALAIGESYRGGKIAYILQPGDPGHIAGQTHGLIAAPTDQSQAVWSSTSVTTGSTSTALGTGNANTNTIIASYQGVSYAAKICYDLVLGGYSDWYLPSKDELNKLYLNQAAIGGFTYYYYWSSSDTNPYFAWVQAFNDGYQNLYLKGYPNYVRAVRAF